MGWPELIRALADLVVALAAIIAAVNARRARKESEETKRTVQALVTQQQSQAIQRHQYFGTVYQQTQSVGEGQEGSRIPFKPGEFPPGQGAGPNDAT